MSHTFHYTNQRHNQRFLGPYNAWQFGPSHCSTKFDLVAGRDGCLDLVEHHGLQKPDRECF